MKFFSNRSGQSDNIINASIVLGLVVLVGFCSAAIFKAQKMNAFDPVELEAIETAESEHDVVLYMTSWCGYCRKMTDFLNSKNIDYVSFDIEKDKAARKVFKKHGGRGVPVAVVKGKVVRGYDPDGVLAALK